MEKRWVRHIEEPEIGDSTAFGIWQGVGTPKKHLAFHKLTTRLVELNKFFSARL